MIDIVSRRKCGDGAVCGGRRGAVVVGIAAASPWKFCKRGLKCRFR